MSLFATLDRESAVRWEANLRTGQWVTAFMGMAALATFTYQRATGVATFVIALLAFFWFTFARGTKGRTQIILWAVTPGFTLALPSLVIVVVAWVQDVQTAFALWVPPIITVCVMALSTARLEPLRPAIYAVIATALYLASWLALTWDVSPAMREQFPQLRPYEQVVRTLFLLGAGVALSMVTKGLKAAIERAARRDRENVLFGKYRLGAPIASGGMASVVEAMYCPEGGFERAAAVKRIHPHLAREPGIVEQFRAEAELGARLAHPNIVAVLDFGRVNDTYFLAMEHIVGIDLRTLMVHCRKRRVHVPPRLAAFIAHQVLEGLAFAHGAARDKDGRLLRVVHRDLAPGNVLIARTGDVKVTDFGIACALKDETRHHTGRLVGSMSYLAPEQVQSRTFDHRADLFAVGVVLHELLAGKRLFKRATDAATLHAVLTERAPSVASAYVPAVWDEVLSRALAKKPIDRFLSARAMADAIEAALMRSGEGLPHADELAGFLRSTGALLEGAATKQRGVAAADALVVAAPEDTVIDEPATVPVPVAPRPRTPSHARRMESDPDIASLPTELGEVVALTERVRNRKRRTTGSRGAAQA